MSEYGVSAPEYCERQVKIIVIREVAEYLLLELERKCEERGKRRGRRESRSGHDGWDLIQVGVFDGILCLLKVINKLIRLVKDLRD